MIPCLRRSSSLSISPAYFAPAPHVMNCTTGPRRPRVGILQASCAASAADDATGCSALRRRGSPIARSSADLSDWVDSSARSSSAPALGKGHLLDPRRFARRRHDGLQRLDHNHNGETPLAGRMQECRRHCARAQGQGRCQKHLALGEQGCGWIRPRARKPPMTRLPQLRPQNIAP